MSGGAHAGGGGHGLKHADDHGHFPEAASLHDLGNRAYSLKPHEKANLQQIEDRLRSGKDLGHHELHEYQHWLEHFSHHMKEILLEEKAEEIANMQLERDLRRAAQLMGEIAARMEHHHH